MKIVCPIDFSAASDHAETEAVDLARALGAEVIFLHVSVETPPYAEGIVDVRKVYEAQRKWATERLGERVQAAEAAGVRARTVLVAGVPFDAIVRTAAQEAADMIVMGTHGRSGLNRFLLGSVTERVLRLAPCPVLTVRERDTTPAPSKPVPPRPAALRGKSDGKSDSRQ
jgi:nucleotide-binding universal stress UspA family protein